MSTLAYSYSEPYKLPAGLLALVVHVAFFVLLYFGVNWHAEPPQGMAVDIWESLPAPHVAPSKAEPPPVEQPKPVVPPKPVEPERPVPPPKADIDLSQKKPKIKPPEIKKPVEITKPAQPKKVEPVQPDPKVLAEQAAQAEQQRVRAEQLAATGRLVDEHKARIIAKIRRNIVMPPDVPDNARAEFDVTLLPGGSVLNARLTKQSGNAAYDSAVERAILKSQPLPLPADVALFNKFRELHLIFSPKE